MFQQTSVSWNISYHNKHNMSNHLLTNGNLTDEIRLPPRAQDKASTGCGNPAAADWLRAFMRLRHYPVIWGLT